MAKTKTANVLGGSGDTARGTWCTPKWLCELIGRVRLDPCANERSHVISDLRACGTGPDDDGLAIAPLVPADWLVYINPPYGHGSVIQWTRAYAHVDYLFLLRWDPSTDWFADFAPKCGYFWFPDQRVNFEPPPGVDSSSNAFPHALYLKSPPNAALRARGITLRAAAL